MAPPPHQYAADPEGGAGGVVVVICDHEALHPFPDALNAVQDSLRVSEWDRKRPPWSIKEGRLDQLWAPRAAQFFEDLARIDGGQWRVFTLVTVNQGPLAGLRAVGMGSNQRKLQ
eukprot:CAMPEP_0198584886 /NCGR_PEP_ID=MMETSP1462-20131121/128605_1 /TAXON_ID=1333877 /ORGANISM="Brandtodinium nutriculum, Strain RCC3387" /LENGTH=114 /DNA_ID=CAMNT_0044316307 /DNA_START=12 /DNA_END=353 /DNA_ORIENTATION=-